MQISARTPSPGGSDAVRLVAEADSDSESDNDVDGQTMQHPVFPLDEDSDAASEAYSVRICIASIRMEGIGSTKATCEC